jgi:uncharacterized protein YbjQ (UPF0145 family)
MFMVTSEEIRRKLEERKKAKIEGQRPKKSTTAGKSPTTNPPRVSRSGMPKPKAPPLREPKKEPVPEIPPVEEKSFIEEMREETPAAEPGEILKHCETCDVDYSNDTNFCPDCGSKLEEYPIPDEEIEEEIEDSPEDFSEEEPAEVIDMVDIPLNAATFNEDIVVVTSNFVPGYKVLETRGFVYGLTVRSRGVGGQIGAGVRSVFGGEIKEYVTMMEDSRNQALERMIAHARSMGANAIISSRFDSDQISNIMQEILAYGTAVIIEKEEESS